MLAGADVAAAATNPSDFDLSFGLVGLVTTPFNLFSSSYGALSIQPDGKIIAGAPFSSGVPPYASLARLGADGTLDTNFQPGLMQVVLPAPK